jgi:hypothetical protein
MPATFVVDQGATFSGIAFLSCEPKIAFGSTEQERTKDGMPRWEVQLVGGFRDPFGRVQNEVIKVGIASDRSPAQGIAQFSPVQLRRFEVGVMERTKNGEIVGVQVWYRAEGITAASPASASAKAGA